MPKPSTEDVSISFCVPPPAQLFLEPSEYGAKYDDSELFGSFVSILKEKKILLGDD